MIRRTFILMATTALVACQGGGITAATWASDASILANGLAGIAPQLGVVTGIPTNVIADAQSALKTAAGFSASLSGIVDPANAQSTVVKVESGINAALAALAPFMSLLPPPVGIALMAAQVLLPVIEAAINPALPKASRTPPAMSAPQARLVLRGTAAKP